MKPLETIVQQEEILVFEHFSTADARGLGTALMEILDREKLPAAFFIRTAGGLTLFQYAAEGAELLNQLWAEKKFETTRIFGKSSLRCFYEAEETGQKIEDHGLAGTCAFAPGAFPIRVKGAGLAAVVSISGLPGFEDHDLLVRVITDYLKR